MGQQDHVLHQFTSLIDDGKYQEAGDCLADDVYFASPKFTYKSKSEWMNKFPTFHEKNKPKGGAENGPKFDPLEAVSDKVFVRKGKVKLFGFHIAVKETIELNDEGKIVRSVMQKA